MKTPALSTFARTLFEARKSQTCLLPARADLYEFANRLLELFFPQLSTHAFPNAGNVEHELSQLKDLLQKIISSLNCGLSTPTEESLVSFIDNLPNIYRSLVEDAEAIHSGDPASQSVDEVIVAYPGFLAIAYHRLAHAFYKLQIPVLPRMLSEYAHRQTGIDIHPGAKIGSSFCIDHGTGIVIGETSVIGDRVKLYQGVTLGALSVKKDLAKKKRHPTLENDVIVYSNATILGGSTVIGQGSIIGGNVWLTKSVPARSTVSQTSEVRVQSGDDAPDWSI